MNKFGRFDLQPLTRIETAWQKPWFLSAASQIGEKHLIRKMPNQDAYRMGSIQGAAWMIIADGVSQAEYSHQGARLATSVVERFFADALSKTQRQPSLDLVKEAFGHAHQQIFKVCEGRGISPKDFACTLVVSLLDGDAIYSGAIGDSSIAAYAAPDRREGTRAKLVPFCDAPQSRNGTFIIHRRDWEKLSTFSKSRSPHIKAVLMCTDGAENFFTRFEDGQDVFMDDHIARYETIFRQAGPHKLACWLSDYLYLQPSQGSDDRTLLIAYRLPSELALPVGVTA